MTYGILLAVSGAIVYGFLGVTFEIAAKRRYAIWDFIFWKQLIGFVIGLGVTLVSGLSLLRQELIFLGLVGALSYVLTCAAYLTASRERDIAANWTIANLSVVLPIMVSILWFGDNFTVAKAAGSGLTLVSIFLIGGGVGGFSMATGGSKWLRYILVAFLLNGVLAMLFRWVPDGLGALFTVYFYGTSWLMAIPYKIAGSRPLKPDPALLKISAAGALSHWMGMMLTMAALAAVGQVSSQAGVVVYPITNGLVIPVGVVLGVMILRQKIDVRSRWGVAAGMTGLALLFLP